MVLLRFFFAPLLAPREETEEGTEEGLGGAGTERPLGALAERMGEENRKHHPNSVLFRSRPFFSLPPSAKPVRARATVRYYHRQLERLVASASSVLAQGASSRALRVRGAPVFLQESGRSDGRERRRGLVG